MKYQTTTALVALVSLAAAEVPQEHSHEKYLVAVNKLLQQDNPLNIVDAVFGLLGNAAAAEGAGDVTNLDCLHQATADSAFSAAKAAGDIEGQANALIFRAIERNTGSVGLKSVLCDEEAENPEIAAISQHQDPASENAAEENKAITLALAQQLASIGADPLLALESGTFAPGDVSCSYYMHAYWGWVANYHSPMMPLEPVTLATFRRMPRGASSPKACSLRTPLPRRLKLL